MDPTAPSHCPGIVARPTPDIDTDVLSLKANPNTRVQEGAGAYTKLKENESSEKLASRGRSMESAAASAPVPTSLFRRMRGPRISAMVMSHVFFGLSSFPTVPAPKSSTGHISRAVNSSCAAHRDALECAHRIARAINTRDDVPNDLRPLGAPGRRQGRASFCKTYRSSKCAGRHGGSRPPQ